VDIVLLDHGLYHVSAVIQWSLYICLEWKQESKGGKYGRDAAGSEPKISYGFFSYLLDRK
jgi:hypothetical protein